MIEAIWIALGAVFIALIPVLWIASRFFGNKRGEGDDVSYSHTNSFDGDGDGGGDGGGGGD